MYTLLIKIYYSSWPHYPHRGVGWALYTNCAKMTKKIVICPVKSWGLWPDSGSVLQVHAAVPSTAAKVAKEVNNDTVQVSTEKHVACSSVLSCVACAGTCCGSNWRAGWHTTISWSCSPRPCVHGARGQRGTAEPQCASMCICVYTSESEQRAAWALSV